MCKFFGKRSEPWRAMRNLGPEVPFAKSKGPRMGVSFVDEFPTQSFKYGIRPAESGL
jgi:hypothetical protein